MDGIKDIDRDQIEQRKERIRRVWDYKSVDHMPLAFILEDFSTYSLREQCENGKIQYEMNVKNIDRLLRLLPDDYIPTARVWPGYITIATMFGLPAHWSNDDNQAPGVLKHIVEEISQVYDLKKPDPVKDGLMPFNLEWLDYFSRNLPPEVSLAGIDLGGPLNTAKDLFDTNLLYTAFYDAPEAYHHFLSLATEVQIDCYREIVQAVGDIERFTSLDFNPVWAPEQRKGFVSDDVCSGFSSEIFKTFSLPYNSRIFQHWRGGRIHNCGPHPAIDLYLHHDPEINGLNCSYMYTVDELPRIRTAFKARGIIELMFDNGESGQEIIRSYEDAAEILTPAVAAIPVVWLNESWTDGDITDLYYGLRNVAKRYARSMKWTGGRSMK